MIESVEGIILSEISYGETSKIINVFTKEYGMIGIMAKGAKQVKSKLRAFTNRFAYGRFFINYKENKLSILNSVDIIDPLKNIHNDLTLISYLTYIADLTEQVVKQTSEYEEIYNLFINVILKLNEKLDPMILTNIIELKYLPYLGVRLNVDSCSICGSKTDIVTIDVSSGGYICKNCYSNQPIMSQKAIKLIRLYYYVEIKSINNFKIDDSTKEEINSFINTFYDDYTGIYIHSKKFLKNILEI